MVKSGHGRLVLDQEIGYFTYLPVQHQSALFEGFDFLLRRRPLRRPAAQVGEAAIQRLAVDGAHAAQRNRDVLQIIDR